MLFLLLLKVNSFEVSLPYDGSLYGYVITIEDDSVVLKTDYGVVVRYDGDHYIFVGIAENYKDKVEGIEVIAK